MENFAAIFATYTIANALYYFKEIIPIIIIAGIIIFLIIRKKKSKKHKKENKTAKITNTENEFQRWKAEREKQTREP